MLLKKSKSFFYLTVFFLAVGLLLRLVLLFHPITQSHFSAVEISKIFILGLLSDTFVFAVACIFLWLYLLCLSNDKYKHPYGYIVFALLVVLLLYVAFGNTILNEYGGSAAEIGTYFIAFKTLLFGLMLFLPQYRAAIRRVLYTIVIFIYVLLIIQNAISEYFFWNEFGMRYNFIAVDYLIYTTEVIGNILESYPVIPIFIALFLITGFITNWIVKKTRSEIEKIPSLLDKFKLTLLYFALVATSLVAIPLLSEKENATNVFANELQANGIYKFYTAFKNNELDYFKFYKTLPTNEAYALLQKEKPLLREIKSDSAETRKNVVLITIESYSAEYMQHYGDTNNLTPFLDSLVDKSLWFTNLYAVGNRTVRGLEAVTLCLPPTAGESVIKRSDNKDKFTTAQVFRKKGYQVKFLYGGDAYFDNMQDFFAGNAYDIIDKKSFQPDEITFSNVWGVCDEDMANKAIKIMNSEAETGRPFFNHWMTVSNHRPYTYPEGRVDNSFAKSRFGGVKYTDFALRHFFAMAKKQSWYNNTVFVILADHCASSAGKTELPLDKYRIPAMIFDPKNKPKQHDVLMSQIDVMPTLFGLLHFNYASKFYGQDVFEPNYKPRAFIATYQNLGFIKDDVMTILSPKQIVKQYQLKQIKNPALGSAFQLYYDEIPMPRIRQDLMKETVSYYQTASDILKKKQYQK